MGILNITPDSFADDGTRMDPDRALADALDMVRDGADILDIGGESTRPGAPAVPADEEWRRVAPVLERLAFRGLPRPVFPLDPDAAWTPRAEVYV